MKHDVRDTSEPYPPIAGPLDKPGLQATAPHETGARAIRIDAAAPVIVEESRPTAGLGSQNLRVDQDVFPLLEGDLLERLDVVTNVLADLFAPHGIGRTMARAEACRQRRRYTRADAITRLPVVEIEIGGAVEDLMRIEAAASASSSIQTKPRRWPMA